MEEGVLRHADVNKGGLQSRFQVLDLALEDCPDQPVVAGALQLELLQDTLVKDSHPLFQGLGVNDDFPVGGIILADLGRQFLQDGPFLGPLLDVLLELFRINRLARFIDGSLPEL